MGKTLTTHGNIARVRLCNCSDQIFTEGPVCGSWGGGVEVSVEDFRSFVYVCIISCISICICVVVHEFVYLYVNTYL